MENKAEFIPDSTIVVYRARFSRLGINTSDRNLREWLYSMKKLCQSVLCPQCGAGAEVRRIYLVCDHCHRGWPLLDLLITEALVTSSRDRTSESAIGSETPPAQPGNNAGPGCASYLLRGIER